MIIPNTELPFTKFNELKDTGIQCALNGYYEEALCNLQTAAYLASLGCPGLFYDEQIDDALRYIAVRLFDQSSVKENRRRNKRIKVGYIVSAILDGGGHIQTLLRLLEYRNKEEFDACVYTTEILDSKKVAPVSFKRLSEMQVPLWSCPQDVSLIEKALLLRDRLKEDNIDIIIILIHPHDVAAIVALLNISSVPSVYYHHYSVAFNLGMHCFDYHIDYRENFYNFCKDIAVVKNHVVIPLPGPSIEYIDLIRARGKEVLGIPEGATVSATAGALYKLFYGNSTIYFDTIAKVLEKNPCHYHILVFDPGHKRYSDEFKKIIEQTPVFKDRLIIMDKQPEIISLLKTVDVYLESFPLGGGNICLEAMACGIPIVALNDIKLNKYSPYPYSIGIKECMASNTDEYVEIATGFLQDNKLRQHLGVMLHNRFLRNHGAEDVTRRYEVYYRECIDTHKPVKQPSACLLRKRLDNVVSNQLRVKGILYSNAILGTDEVEGILQSGAQAMLDSHPYVSYIKDELSNTDISLRHTEETLRHTEETLRHTEETLRHTQKKWDVDRILAERIRRSPFYKIYMKYIRPIIN